MASSGSEAVLQGGSGLEAEDALRADLYDLLAVLLSRPPSAETLASVAGLTGDGSDLGRGITALARLARATTPKAAEREFNALFIGLGRGELLPYGSYYLTGFLNEKPLAVLRGHMAKLGIARASEVIRGDFGGGLSLTDQNAFFNSHLAPWAAHFFTDLEGAKGSVFYAPVGLVGRAFIGIEAEAFRLDGQT